MKKKDIWAVIPAYNEGKTVSKVIQGVKKHISNIVVVVDGSKDNTTKAVKDAGAVVLEHVVNLGKGAAIKTGCDFAIKQGAKVLVLIDADMQHDPDEIPNFIDAFKGSDVVFGYRKRDKNMPFILRYGNFFINKVTKLLYGIDLRDTQCGYRALTAKAYRKVRWKAGDYSMESEMIANAGKNKLKYSEVPIKTIYSDRYKGTNILDGVKIVLNMLWWKLRR